MEKKLQRAVTWLKKVYGSEPIPEFQVNESTVDFLYNLAECNEARESEAALQIENMKQRAEEYEAKTKYLQGLFRETLAISLCDLSSKGTSYVNGLVKSAMALKTKDTSLVSYFCAINDMTSKLHATESKNKEIILELTSRRDELTAALVLEQRLKDDLKKSEEYLEAEKLRSCLQSRKLEFLKSKSKDLAIRIKTAEEQLAASGWDQSLTHGSLVNLSQEVAKLREETAHLNKKLEVYQDLPLSIPLAKVKIEDAKQELNKLEEELSKELDNLALEMVPPRKKQFT